MSDNISCVEVLIPPRCFPVCFQRLWSLCFQFPHALPPSLKAEATRFLQAQTGQRHNRNTQSLEAYVVPDLCLLTLFDYTFRALTFLEDVYQRSLFERTYIYTHANQHVFLPMGPACEVQEVTYRDKVVRAYADRVAQEPYYRVFSEKGRTYVQIHPLRAPGKKELDMSVRYVSGYKEAPDLPSVYQNAVYDVVRGMIANGGMLPQKEDLSPVLPPAEPQGLVFGIPSNDAYCPDHSHFLC